MRKPLTLFLHLIFLNLGAVSVFGQNGTAHDEMNFKVIPPGPEASALGNFIDVPVSLYTGKVDISIPIYTVQSYSLSMPISLSYNTGGIKIEDIPSFVGAGWSLNAGGMISRAVRGKADEDGFGFFSPGFDNYYNADGTININNEAFTCSSPNSEQAVIALVEGQFDFQPDSWFFNFGNYSGKIVFTREMEPMLIPRQNIQIVQTPFTGQGPATGPWVIRDELGNTYTFTMMGMTSVKECSLTDSEVNFPNTWLLTHIQSTSGLDEITLEYENETITYSQLTYQTRRNLISHSNVIPPSPPYNDCHSEFTVSEPKLRKISSKNGFMVLFNRDTEERFDLQGGHRLKSIEVRFNGKFVKEFRLSHSYNGNTLHYHANYLMLGSLREYDEQGNPLSPGYIFDYYPGILPGRNSHNKDYWGYYNGASNNTSIPRFLNDDYDFPGADREANLSYAKIGNLKRVTYPTGGYTEYEYELNSFTNFPESFNYVPHYYTAAVTGDGMGPVTDIQTVTFDEETLVTLHKNMPCENQAIDCYYEIRRNGVLYNMPAGESGPSLIPPGTYTLFVSLGSDNSPQYAGVDASITLKHIEKIPITVKYGGGLRIKKIIFHDGETIAYNKTFEYTLPDGSTSGKIMSYPTHEYFSIHEYGHTTTHCSVDGGAYYLVRNASSNVSLGTTKGSYVGYDRVTVYTESPGGNRKIGKSVSEFSNDPHSTPSSYPFIYSVNTDYKNGLLLKQTDYVFKNGNYEIVRSLENNYVFSDIQRIHAMQVSPSKVSPCIGCDYTTFLYNTSYDQTEAVLLTSSTETLFTGSDYHVTRNYYQYDPNTYLRTKTFTYNSDGTLHYTLNRYTGNFSNGDMTNPLQEKAVSGALIEKQVWVADASEVPEESVSDPGYTPDLSKFKLVRAVYNVYNNLALHEKQFFLHPHNPLSTEQFTPSQGNSIPEDPGFKLENSVHAYDDKGNLLSFTDKKGYPTSFLWGYSKTYPIAQVLNANHDQIFVQNFEEYPGASQDEEQAHTGLKYLNQGSFSHGFTPQGNTADYAMDYWYFEAGKWNAVIGVPFNPTINNTGSRLDDIRIYPKTASITSYTYKPGSGISSVIDPNGVVQYYEYDSFGRLSVIKDNNRNIVKHIEYHYKDNHQE